MCISRHIRHSPAIIQDKKPERTLTIKSSNARELINCLCLIAVETEFRSFEKMNLSNIERKPSCEKNRVGQCWLRPWSMLVQRGCYLLIIYSIISLLEIVRRQMLFSFRLQVRELALPAQRFFSPPMRRRISTCPRW